MVYDIKTEFQIRKLRNFFMKKKSVIKKQA